jgi:hypothetical protein
MNYFFQKDPGNDRENAHKPQRSPYRLTLSLINNRTTTTNELLGLITFALITRTHTFHRCGYS